MGVFLIVMAMILLAMGWVPRNSTRSDRLDNTVLAAWLIGVFISFRVAVGDDVRPFFILSTILGVIWFGSILWLPKNSQIPKHAISPLKGLLLGFATAPIFLILGLLDREHRGGWFAFILFWGILTFHEFLVRLRTEPKTLTSLEN